MSGLVIVIPIKDPAGAKQRLGAALPQARRTELACALLEQTLRFVRAHAAGIPVLLVTDCSRFDALAADFGCTVLHEGEGGGETLAVERATSWSVVHGYTSQLVIPADMAAMDPAEFATLLAQPRPSPSLVLCPATGDDGTNAVLSTPPGAVPFRFGARSFDGYRARAATLGVPVTVLRLASFRLDIDTPEDLNAFLAACPGTPVAARVRAWLAQSATHSA